MEESIEGAVSDQTDSDSETSHRTGFNSFRIDLQYTDYRKLASPNPTCTLDSFEAAYQSNPAFQSFREKLTKFLKWFLPHCNISIPPRNFRLDPVDEVRKILNLLNFTNFALIDNGIQISAGHIYMLSQMGPENGPSSMQPMFFWPSTL